MDINHFEDKELNKLPCGIVAFANHAPWTIIHANDMYFSQFANNNLSTLNIYKEDEPGLNSLAPRLSHGEKSANLLFRAYSEGEDAKKIVMSASRYGENAFLGVLWDATDRSRMIEEVEKEKEKFAMALCNSKNIVFEHNLKKKTQVFYVPIEDENTVETIKKAGSGLGIPEDAIHPDDKQFFLANVYNPSERTIAGRMKMPNDSDFKWYRVNRQFEYDDEGEVARIYGVFVNIDKEKREEQERIAESEVDPNLGIFYRNAAVKRINMYLKGNTERRDYALLVMDIDNFKNINDSYGHLYGDTVIEKVAGVLKDTRPNFAIPGRYGGDEFFLFVHSADKREIKQTADDILLRLLDFRLPNGGNVTCSIGIARGEDFDNEPDYKMLFEKADKALYAAKKNGKAQWKMYNAGMEESSGRAIDYEIEDESSAAAMESKDLMKAFLELSSTAKTSEGAIYNIIKYITAKFDFDWMQVMQVNCKDDLITIRYEWSRDPEFRNSAGKSGYYVHSDIMKFRNYFEKHPVFEVIPSNTEGFSPKFQREFEKNQKYNIIYISDTTADENFYMFTCIRFDKEKVWTPEEMEGLNVATKIMTMFIAQTGKESERERELQEKVDYDQRTGLFAVEKFYEQLGRLRKLATENDEEIILFNIDIGNFLYFNRKYTYRGGDGILGELGQRMLSNSSPDYAVSTRLEGTDIFFRAFRVKKGDYGFIEKYKKEHQIFCEQINNKYPGVNLCLRTGIYKLKPNEDGGIGFDKALEAKKLYKGDRSKTFMVWYEE